LTSNPAFQALPLLQQQEILQYQAALQQIQQLPKEQREHNLSLMAQQLNAQMKQSPAWVRTLQQFLPFQQILQYSNVSTSSSNSSTSAPMSF
jgi:hypothetical protein